MSDRGPEAEGRAPPDGGSIPRVDIHRPDFAEALKAAVDEFGVAVVKGAATAAELAAGEELAWRFMERDAAPTGIKRDVPGTHTDKAFHSLGFARSGVVTEFSVGQSDFLWFSRTLPGVRKIFRSLWGVERDCDLVTSFDGCGIARNPFVSPADAALGAKARRPLPRMPAEEFAAEVARVEAEAAEAMGDFAPAAAAGAAGGAGGEAAVVSAGRSKKAQKARKRAKALEEKKKRQAEAAAAAAAVTTATPEADMSEDAGDDEAGPESPTSADAPPADEGGDRDTRDWQLRKSYLTHGRWFHLDQNGHEKPRFDLWQGLLNYFPATGATGSTVVVVGSHRDAFTRVFRSPHRKKSRGAFVMLNRPGDYEEFCADAVQVTLDAGDFMLWDSRVVHCNQGVDPRDTPEAGAASLALPGRETHPLARLVAYVSMAPRDRLTDKQSAMRRAMVEAGMTGTHQPIVTALKSRESATSKRYACPPATSPIWGLV
uniref:Uncharacterized protein n=1 Tax=Bicosoecida sp. CB-2014 TaxID=1486930 RepID=A0A7S1CK18_9STRA|mmetsp:Transcript_3789/g.14050  ORF Transcript_3789/g.14050 Transcript_3789/m.14050 type:complete len:487 (+) Transcript_3789:165-1625(+)